MVPPSVTFSEDVNDYIIVIVWEKGSDNRAAARLKI